MDSDSDDFSFRKFIHIIFELIAVVFIVPYLIYLIMTKRDCLKKIDIVVLTTVAIGTILVDGGLLFSYLRLY